MARLTKEIKKWKKVPNDPDGAELLIKHIKPGDLQKIADETMELTQSGNAVYMDVKVDPGKKRWKVLTSAILDWRGYFDENGNHMEFNHDNLARVVIEEEGFSITVDMLRKELADEIAVKLEVASENLQNSPSGQVG
jgi:hypothetical protein